MKTRYESDTQDLETLFARGMTMAMASNRDLFLTYEQDTVKNNQALKDKSAILAMKSTDGGVNFVNLSPVKTGITSLDGSPAGAIRKQSFPSVTVSLSTAYVHLAWGSRDVVGQTDGDGIHFIRFTNSSQTWSTATTRSNIDTVPISKVPRGPEN